jgi:hypothetical protein
MYSYDSKEEQNYYEYHEEEPCICYGDWEIDCDIIQWIPYCSICHRKLEFE